MRQSKPFKVLQQQRKRRVRSKGGTAVRRAGLGATERRFYGAGETEDECGRQTGDYRGDKEAVGGRYGAKAAAVAPAPVAATPKVAPAKTSAPVKRGGLTAAGRQALSISMKKRWAKKKWAAAKGKAA